MLIECYVGFYDDKMHLNGLHGLQIAITQFTWVHNIRPQDGDKNMQKCKDDVKIQI